MTGFLQLVPFSLHQLVRWLVIATVLTAGAPATRTHAQSETQPLARRGQHHDTYHGTRVHDPYRWMEDLSSEELMNWMTAQDEFRAALVHDNPVSKTIQRRMLELGSYASQGVPIRRGTYTFTFRRAADDQYGKLFVQQDGESDARPLLDLGAFNREGMSVFVNSYSPTGRYLSYEVSEDQSRWKTVFILRTSDGNRLNETVTGFRSGMSNIAWVPDRSGFFYTRYEVPDDPQAPVGTPRVFYHELGTPQNADGMIYERPAGEKFSLNLKVTHDGRFLIISGSLSGGTLDGLYDRVFYKDLRDERGDIHELFPDLDATFAVEDSDGELLRVRTTLNAPNMRVVELTPQRSSPGSWREIVPESDSPIRVVTGIGNRLVIQYIKDAREIARIYDFDGRMYKEIDHLVPTMSVSGDRNSNAAFYSANTLISPSIYALDVVTGATELHFSPERDLIPNDFVTEQVFFESADGTRVPMYLVHLKDIEMDGSNPVFMYGYGAWAWSAFPWQSHMVPWVEMGGIYAVPNIRGGGEYGEVWHEAGIRRNKQNGIDDFIAAGEWLIDHGYTSPSRLVANGGSASGVIAGAAVLQRPELFAASVINFPALDKLRYTEFGSARSWIPEFGDPNDPADFQTLMKYSPYHNVKDGECYPPTWVQVGDKDDTTTPMHGYKFVARMQAAQSCQNPVVLKIAWGAGHSYGLTAEQIRETQAEELAFLVRVLGMDAQRSIGALSGGDHDQ